MGVSAAVLRIPKRPDQVVPQARTRTAYQLEVSAVRDTTEIGRSRPILAVGTVPNVRLRATPSLARPGDQVQVEIFRGPQSGRSLPESLWLRDGSVYLEQADVEGNAATFSIPEDAEGFLHVEWAGARTVVYVQEAAPLTVTLSTDAPAYAPGTRTELTVRTAAGGKPQPAAVGLVGVDQTLSQLAPLLGADDYGRVTVLTEAERPAFDSFDPRALALGQVTGENAAKAALLRISHLPTNAAGDQPTSATAEVVADTDGATLAAFYRVLEATRRRVRQWEEAAPQEEQMDPSRMVAFYQETLVALEQAGEAAVDGYGRPLTLGALPYDLLEQLEPRALVADATRLPEDVVSFTRYVDEEVVQ